MVAEAELTWVERCEIDRQRHIERARATGNHELAEIYRSAVYDDDSTPEEDAEDARISTERIARMTDRAEQPDVIEELEALYPEDVRLFKQLDEAFPDWDAHIDRLPEEHPEELDYLRRLDELLPEAAAFFRDWHDEQRRD